MKQMGCNGLFVSLSDITQRINEGKSSSFVSNFCAVVYVRLLPIIFPFLIFIVMRITEFNKFGNVPEIYRYYPFQGYKSDVCLSMNMHQISAYHLFSILKSPINFIGNVCKNS